MKKGLIITLILAIALIAGCATGGAPKDPVFYNLYAKEAKLTSPHGNLQIETGGAQPNVGYWGKLDDVVTWEVTVEYSCNYEVFVNYSLAEVFTGSVVEVKIGDQVITWDVKSTAEDWSNFVTKSLGIVKLDAGTYPVTMQATVACEGDQYDNHFVANIRKVTLTTVK